MITMWHGIVSQGGVPFAPSQISGMVFDHDCDLIPGNDGDAIASHTFEVAFSQATVGKRPVLKKAANGINGHNILRFSGAQAWRSTAAIDLSSTNGTTVFVVAKVTGAAADRILYEFGVSVATAGGFGFNFGNTDKGNATLMGNVNLSIATTLNAAILSTPAAILYGGLYDMSLSSLEAKALVNGAYVSTNPTYNNNNTANFGNLVFFVGARNEGSLYITADIARIVAYNRTLTTAERIQVENYLRELYALDDNIAIVDEFADNGRPSVQVGTDKKPYIRTTPGARLVYTTEATSVDVTSYNDIYGPFPASTEIGVRIDGADYGVIAPGAAGEVVTSAFALGSGAKTVEFINGGGSSPGGGPGNPLLGTFVRGLSFNAAATNVTASEPITPRLYVYGDSITSGFDATNNSLEGWVQLVRNEYAGSVLNDSWGFRALYRDAATATMRAAFAAYIASLNPSIIWLAIGVNDYGGSLWTAADFGTAYADLLDKINALLPSATIYCQTPLDRSAEGANGLGSTLPNYRTEISNAGTARAYCVVIDGTSASYPGTALMTDGVHPTTAGHALYAAAVIAELGL